jgi:endonuclease YncB( thermonuclease family)
MKKIISLLLLLAIPLSVFAVEQPKKLIEAKVIKVTDGDTIKVQV